MNFVVRDIDFSEYASAQRLLADNGWSHRVADEVHFRMLCENSQQVLVAVNDRQVIGFVRALTDRVSNGYISMLVVHPQFRRRGIGKALIQAVMSYGSPTITWTLRAGRSGASEFFTALGFSQSSEAMELKRQSV
jgi:ribosomal protein S18 acetylase RimI-like enzyme